MEAPSQSEFGVRLRKAADPIEPITSHSAQADFELKLHNHELSKHHLADRSEDDRSEGVAVDEPSQHDVDYTFGDDGSQWRMTRLKGIYRRAEDTGEDVDDVALKQYGDLRLFDDAREEESELDRRKTYGPGYVGKDKPNGELFLERTLAAGARKGGMLEVDPGDKEGLGMQLVQDSHTPRNTVTLDQTALNKLKAQMMKAKLRGAPELAELEAQYEAATAAIANGKQPNVIVLSTMDNRMLAGGRNGEVKNIDNRRGRERGLVEENEDMSLEDMVREERRTKEKAGGEGQRFAERIAKDAKFDVRNCLRVERTHADISRTTWSTWTRMLRSWQNAYRSPRSTFATLPSLSYRRPRAHWTIARFAIMKMSVSHLLPQSLLWALVRT